MAARWASRTDSIGSDSHGIPPPSPPSSAADVQENRTYILSEQGADGTEGGGELAAVLSLSKDEREGAVCARGPHGYGCGRVAGAALRKTRRISQKMLDNAPTLRYRLSAQNAQKYAEHAEREGGLMQMQSWDRMRRSIEGKMEGDRQFRQSGHAHVRCQQRGVSMERLLIVRTYGKRERTRDGFSYSMDKAARRRAERHLDPAIYRRNADKLNLYIVVARDGETETVVTVAHRLRRRRAAWRGPRRRIRR